MIKYVLAIIGLIFNIMSIIVLSKFFVKNRAGRKYIDQIIYYVLSETKPKDPSDNFMKWI